MQLADQIQMISMPMLWFALLKVWIRAWTQDAAVGAAAVVGRVVQGRYQGARKNGEGVYCFTNQDVYEGEFKDDRMAGCGVYTFYPEGR